MSDPLRIQNDPKGPVVPPALLYEMMRSFEALARTLNLSQAVEQLCSTRQTVRRHIAQLEEAMGGKLFEVHQRQYCLTDLGARALKPSRLLLDQGRVWYRGDFQHVRGLLRFSYEAPSGSAYHQQQQQISTIWSGESELLRAALKAWTASEGKIESPNLAKVRPYILVFRENSDGWVCVEVGEKSFYSNWFGWAEARSSVGRNLQDLPGGEDFASLTIEPFIDVSLGHGVRLDQVVAKMQFGKDEAFQHLAFDRLLLGVHLPDGTPAIISVVDRARTMGISDLDGSVLDDMPAKASVDFVP